MKKIQALDLILRAAAISVRSYLLNYGLIENCHTLWFKRPVLVLLGSPVHIWRVEENSLADRAGLQRGQEIVQANGVDFTNISHVDALKVKEFDSMADV